MGKSKSRPKEIKIRVGMIVLTDLILGNVPDNAPIFHRLGIAGNKAFKKKPESCPVCEKNHFVGLEVMGATNKGPLFWLCSHYEELLLRYTMQTTRKYLREAQQVWTNPHDWEIYKQTIN